MLYSIGHNRRWPTQQSHVQYDVHDDMYHRTSSLMYEHIGHSRCASLMDMSNAAIMLVTSNGTQMINSHSHLFVRFYSDLSGWIRYQSSICWRSTVDSNQPEYLELSGNWSCMLISSVARQCSNWYMSKTALLGMPSSRHGMVRSHL
jgi:drug/metabolite transporter superfamily protein YnfA